jgi:hypothetical protein
MLSSGWAKTKKAFPYVVTVVLTVALVKVHQSTVTPSKFDECRKMCVPNAVRMLKSAARPPYEEETSSCECLPPQSAAQTEDGGTSLPVAGVPVAGGSSPPLDGGTPMPTASTTD